MEIFAMAGFRNFKIEKKRSAGAGAIDDDDATGGPLRHFRRF